MIVLGRQVEVFMEDKVSHTGMIIKPVNYESKKMKAFSVTVDTSHRSLLSTYHSTGKKFVLGNWYQYGCALQLSGQVSHTQ